MKARTLLLAAAVAMFAASSAAFAGAPETPGHEMKQDTGPGASDYTSPGTKPNTPPGQQMQDDSASGASEYSPGHTDTSSTGASSAAPGQVKNKK